MVYLHAENRHAGVRDTAWHGDRLVYLVLQPRMVTGIVFPAQELQAAEQVVLVLQPSNPTESNHTAEISGVLIGMNLVLVNHSERALVFLEDRIDFMSFDGGMEI